jgi:hypothetical protein
MSESTQTVAKKGGALSALKAMTDKKKVPEQSTFATTVNDVAIKGAKRVKNKVRLGLDLEFEGTAKQAAEAKRSLEKAEEAFKIYQGQVRDYGIAKREIWNDTFKANDTTVEIPYEVDTPEGKEEKVIQVICSNKYSVRAETVEQVKGNLGEQYDRLFTETTDKILRPNCVDLMRGILVEAGMGEDEVDAAMDQLFEEKTKISTTAEYEQEVKKLEDEDLKAILDQAVTRSQPSLKFP